MSLRDRKRAALHFMIARAMKEEFDDEEDEMAEM